MKQTEVGLIPDDWEVKTLANLCELKAGKVTSLNDINKVYPCYGGNGIRGFISQYSHDGVYPIIGRQGELCGNVNLAKGKFYATEHAVVATPRNSVNPIWLYYQLIALDLNQYAKGCAQPGLSVESLNNVLSIFPPHEEQQRIAKALSDVDALITTTEKLIQKKKNIKQGTMQNLLTGKKRLPGFAKSTEYKQTELGLIPEDWEVKQLGDFSTTSSGGTPSREIKDFYTGNIKWFTTTELKDCLLYDSMEHITQEAINRSSAKIFPKKTLLIAMYGATIGRLGILNYPAATNQACCAIFTQNMIVLYLYYFLLNNREKIISMGCGAGQPNISQEIVKKILIPIPSKEEQTAIANVLSCMDKEIESLNTKLEKYRNLKTAMMQQLLTGKIRLG